MSTNVPMMSTHDIDKYIEAPEWIVWAEELVENEQLTNNVDDVEEFYEKIHAGDVDTFAGVEVLCYKQKDCISSWEKCLTNNALRFLFGSLTELNCALKHFCRFVFRFVQIFCCL